MRLHCDMPCGALQEKCGWGSLRLSSRLRLLAVQKQIILKGVSAKAVRNRQHGTKAGKW